jgi:hypothetical protein
LRRLFGSWLLIEIIAKSWKPPDAGELSRSSR